MLTGFSKRNKKQDKIVFGIWLPFLLICIGVANKIITPQACYLMAALFVWLIYSHCCPSHFAGRVK